MLIVTLLIMPVFRYWTKGLGKTKFKRVSEYCFNSSVDERDKKCLSSVKNPHLPVNPVDINNASSPKSDLLAAYCSTLPVQSDVKLESERKTLCITSQLQQFFKLTPLSSISSSILHHVSVLPVLNSTCNYSTDNSVSSGSTASDSDKQTSGPSVLKSMGLEENDQDAKKDETNDTKNSKKKDEKSEESAFLRSQRYAKWTLLATIGIGTPLFIMEYGGQQYDDFGNPIHDQYSDSFLPVAYIRRAWGEVNSIKRVIVEPSSKKLLPDPLKEPYYQPPYTLVIELMDVFLRPVYDSVTGWRFKKRPGIDYFLSQVGPPLFEVVIFTRETGMTAFPLIESMDQKGYIMYRLFRDAARYKSGFSIGNPMNGEMPKLDPYYQKDLTYLNRDLSKVIMVDCDKRAFEKQPENGLSLEKWDGSSDDTTLYDLAGLLRAIGTSNVEDVRPVLRHYAENDKPLETFKLAQARMQEDSRLAAKVGSSSSLFAGASSTVSSLIRRR